MPTRKPLFSSEGSVYRRVPYVQADEDEQDEDDVDASLPSSPVDEFPPGSSGEGTGSRAWQYAMRDAEDDYRRALRYSAPSADRASSMKREATMDNDEEEDELREVNSDDGDYAHIGRQPVDSEEQHEEEEVPDDRQCRICFMGAEEEETMGKLISPCLCSGSVRYVHVNCINAWRGTGRNARAFMECPQCGHKYQLRRTLVSGLAQSKPLTFVLSTVIFITLTLLAGHILHYYLLRRTAASKKASKAKSKSWFSHFRQKTWDDWYFDDEDDDDGGGIIIIGAGGTLVYDIVIGAIQTFTTVANTFTANRSKFADALPPGVAFVIFALGVRFLLGLAVLGSMSFLSLLLSLSLFAPLQIANHFRGSFLNFGRRGRLRGDGTAAGQIVIIVFVLIGAVNTLVQVYRLVESLTYMALKYVETQILEVNPEERRKARRRQPVWWKRWFREQRYAEVAGWQEIGIRMRVWAQYTLGPLWERVWRHPREGYNLDGAGERIQIEQIAAAE